MKVYAIQGSDLLPFLKQRLVGDSSFRLYTHILTEPFISFFCSLPLQVKKTSMVFLDENKRGINDYAARKLLECGYRDVFYTPNLHAKVLLTPTFTVIGSANFSSRALTQNFEVILVIEGNYILIGNLVGVVRRIHTYSMRVTLDMVSDSVVDKS